MRLSNINESYDKNLGDKVAMLLRTTPMKLRATVGAIDKSSGLKYGVWVLKQLSERAKRLDDSSGDRLDGDMMVKFIAELTTLLSRFESFKDRLVDKNINSYSAETLEYALSELDLGDKVLDLSSLDGIDVVYTEKIGDVTIKALAVYNADSLASLCAESDLCIADEDNAAALIEGANCPMLVFLRNDHLTSVVLFNGEEHANSNNTDETRVYFKNLAARLLPNLLEKFKKHCADTGCDKPICRWETNDVEDEEIG